MSGLYSYDLCSCGLRSYGLYSYDLYNYGLDTRLHTHMHIGEPPFRRPLDERQAYSADAGAVRYGLAVTPSDETPLLVAFQTFFTTTEMSPDEALSRHRNHCAEAGTETGAGAGHGDRCGGRA